MVRWGGKDVTVEMRETSLPWRRDGLVGSVHLVETDRASSELPAQWTASAELPNEIYTDGEGDTILFSGEGASAQEALDSLVAQLQQIADWVTAALGASP
jgi:hypothetical protein